MRRTPAPRKALDGLHAYAEEAHAPLNLSNNTNLFDPNPAFAEALASFDPELAREYPSLDSARFREAVARQEGCRAEQVITGNGSNDLLDLAFRAFCEPGERVAWHPPSFEMIEMFARAAGCQVQAVPLRAPGFDLDAASMVEARAKVTVLCWPNNPTGHAFPRADVERVAREGEGLVVVDEAYGAFHGESVASLVRELPNLMVVRTMSKAHGLAALRLGYAIAQEPVIQALGKVRGPFRLNALTEHVGVHALQRTDYVDRVVQEVRRERARLEVELRTRAFAVPGSDANFVLCKPAADAHLLHAALERRGIAVRKFTSAAMRPWLRATVGPRWVTQRFLAELDDSLREVGPR